MGHGYNFREKTESAGPKGMGAKTLRRLEITPGKNGGQGRVGYRRRERRLPALSGDPKENSPMNSGMIG